jgi:hypothetical protein
MLTLSSCRCRPFLLLCKCEKWQWTRCLKSFLCGLFANITIVGKNNDKHYSSSFCYGLQMGKNDDKKHNYLLLFCYGLQAWKNNNEQHNYSFLLKL